MKTCRLKIIASNIIDNIDKPSIHYISQNKKGQINIDIEENKEMDNLDDKLFGHIEVKEENVPKENNEMNQIQIGELIKYDLINNNQNIEKKAKNEIKEEDTNNVDINDLCTISNQNFYEEDKKDNNINIKDNIISDNFNTINNSNNYPYHIEHKKRELNSGLRNIFKFRDKKPYINRSLSQMNSKNKNKKIIIKNILSFKNKNQKKTKNTNDSKENIDKKNMINNKYNPGNILKININKSFCLNNQINNNNINKSIKLKAINRNLNSNSNKKKSHSKNSNNSNKKVNSNNNNYNKIKREIQPLKIKKINFEVEAHSSIVSWNIIEKNDFNLDQSIDYKLLIDDLLIKECQLVQEKENIIQTYENKLKPLRDVNKQLIEENDEELDRQDELKGELIVLKNQYEKLFSLLNSDKNKESFFELNNYFGNEEKNKYHEEFNKKIEKIDKEMKELNISLSKGEILLVTKPAQINNLSENKIKNITLMLKGIFLSRHIYDTDKVVDLIWKYDKKLQTIYFLVKQLINYFLLEQKSDKEILINYFYSFSKDFNYMSISTFKKNFKKIIGNLQILNKYIYLSKLKNYHGSKIKPLIKLLKEKDLYNLGVIKYDIFAKSLDEVGLNLFLHNSENSENSKDLLEFLIFCMKKNCTLELDKKNEKFEIRYSLFDLIYENLNDFINEYNSSYIKKPLKEIRKYMIKNDINNVELIFRPLLKKNYVININGIEYFDIIILNKYLKKIGIIQKDEKIWVDTFEDELIDKNKFIEDIYDYDMNSNNEESSLEKIKKNADNFIDEILGSFK